MEQGRGHQGWLQPMVTLQNGDPKWPDLLLLTPLEVRALIKLLEVSTHRVHKMGSSRSKDSRCEACREGKI